MEGAPNGRVNRFDSEALWRPLKLASTKQANNSSDRRCTSLWLAPRPSTWATLECAHNYDGCRAQVSETRRDYTTANRYELSCK